MKQILCVKVSPENKDFLKQLSIDKQRSASNIINVTIGGMKQIYEWKKDNGTTR